MMQRQIKCFLTLTAHYSVSNFIAVCICFVQFLALYLVPERDDCPTVGSSDRFDMYIGDGKGIQGHYNSCYLDSTVFALFALGDSFDSLLFGNSPSQDGQRIQEIILKGIVNPLRT